jgi:hypothetical protein
MDLKNEAYVHGPFALVVVDTSVVFFEGKDENDNVQAVAHGRTMRSLTELAGGPTTLVNCHPTKNATAENLLPRGGGAFANELDGNLTCTKREKIAELHYQGKFRGADFAPIPFLLTAGTNDMLKDSKGRSIGTVTARPLGQDEKAAHDAAAGRNEDRVLKLIVDQPGLSIADMAKALGWVYATGEPDKSRTQRALKALAEDGFAKMNAGRWEATKAGRQKAKNRDTAEEPF